jgi:Starch-binding associating with outer membrane
MKIKSIIITAIVAIFGTSCTESYLDINTNPNTLPTASPSFVFTNALNTAAANMVSPNEIGSYWSGQWTQSNGYIISTTTFAYNFTNGDFNYWDGYYDNLMDYQFVIDNADAYNQKYLKGPAKIMKALLYQQLVDMYGSVPYSDALKGVASLAPKFDDQKTVYDGLITTLDEAIAETKANAFASAFTGSDIVFKGNTTKWIKFANGLKMRILMRQARVSGKDTYIKTEINKIVTEGSGFLTTEEVGSGGNGFFLATAGKLNPVYDRWGYDANGAKRALNNYPRLTQFLVNSMKASGDTVRLKRIGYAIGGEGSTPGVSTKAEVAANYVGAPFGTSSGFLPASCSAIGPSLLVKGEFNRPYIIMTAAEVLLNLAEAKERFGAGVNLTGTAKEYFEEGIKQSHRALGAKSDGVAALVSGGKDNYDYTASTNKLSAIAIQKWLAVCNFNGLEAWSEYRKTGLPKTPQSIQVPESGEKRPVRFFYPNTESGSNAENVKAQGTIDVFSTRLFWDVD